MMAMKITHKQQTNTGEYEWFRDEFVLEPSIYTEYL